MSSRVFISTSGSLAVGAKVDDEGADGLLDALLNALHQHGDVVVGDVAGEDGVHDGREEHARVKGALLLSRSW